MRRKSQKPRPVEPAALSRDATRAAIEARWSNRILDARARLCASCKHGVGPEPGRDCEMSLLPITLAGADCPYWQGRS